MVGGWEHLVWNCGLGGIDEVVSSCQGLGPLGGASASAGESASMLPQMTTSSVANWLQAVTDVATAITMPAPNTRWPSLDSFDGDRLIV